MMPITLLATDAHYPARLRERLGEATPEHLSSLGNMDLLTLPKLLRALPQHRHPPHPRPSRKLARRWPLHHQRLPFPRRKGMLGYSPAR
jgi:hypothetical protein